MTHLRRLAALVMAVPLVGACGDGRSATPATTTTSAPATTTTGVATPAAGTTSAGLQLDLHGLGPVRVGMTIEAAAQALGRPLEAATAPSEACTLYAPASGFEGLDLLVAEGTVARVDVNSGPTTTVAGMAIGQTEAEAQRHYGNRLRVTQHDFVLGGHYLTLVPTDPGDAGFRLVAETDGSRITGMRAGRLPEVELSEVCA